METNFKMIHLTQFNIKPNLVALVMSPRIPEPEYYRPNRVFLIKG